MIGALPPPMMRRRGSSPPPPPSPTWENTGGGIGQASWDSVTSLDSGRVVAVGADLGDLVSGNAAPMFAYSDDYGNTWTQGSYADVGTEEIGIVYSVASNGSTLRAVAKVRDTYTPVIISSSDGATWSHVQTMVGDAAYSRMQYASRSALGVFCFWNGEVLYTSGDGQTWTVNSTPFMVSTANPVAICPDLDLSNNILLVCMDDSSAQHFGKVQIGVLGFSDSQVINWSWAEPYSLALMDDSVLIASLDGTLYSSQDLGSTWSQEWDEGYNNSFSLSLSGSDSTVVTGPRLSHDSGGTWQDLTYPGGVRPGAACLAGQYIFAMKNSSSGVSDPIGLRLRDFQP